MYPFNRCDSNRRSYYLSFLCKLINWFNFNFILSGMCILSCLLCNNLEEKALYLLILRRISNKHYVIVVIECESME